MKGSPYETTALVQIHAYKNPKLTWFDEVMTTIQWPLDKASNLVLDTPGVGDAIRLAVQGLTSVCNDLAHWSVRPNAIYEEYRKAGHEDVRKPSDVFRLDLEDVDRVIGWLAMKYKGVATVEGTVAGVAGLPGIPPDIVALISLNLRAIGEYATYCGFDISSQAERLFALNVLGLASSPTDGAKALAMAELVKISRAVAAKRTWNELQKQVLVRIIQRIAKALGIRLTKAKLAQVLPIAGGFVGGGFNAYFTDKVCDAAYYLYRERFLAEKYGPDIIEVTVKPADDFDPHYPEEDEQI
jgi:hypothetical protein